MISVDLSPEEVAALRLAVSDGLDVAWRNESESAAARAGLAKILAAAEAAGMKLPRQQSAKSKKLFDTLNGRRK